MGLTIRMLPKLHSWKKNISRDLNQVSPEEKLGDNLALLNCSFCGGCTDQIGDMAQAVMHDFRFYEGGVAKRTNQATRFFGNWKEVGVCSVTIFFGATSRNQSQF